MTIFHFYIWMDILTIVAMLPSCHHLLLGPFPAFIKCSENLHVFFLIAFWVAIIGWCFSVVCVGWQRKPHEITETLIASAADVSRISSSMAHSWMRMGTHLLCVPKTQLSQRIRDHFQNKACANNEEGTVNVSLYVKREESHLFMAVVVMVEVFCTFVIIGPSLISRGLLPCSVEVTSTVCKS